MPRVPADPKRPPSRARVPRERLPDPTESVRDTAGATSLDSGGRLDVRTLVAGSLTVLAVGVGFFLIYRFATALFSFFAGIALGTAVKPAVERLRRRGVPRWAGALAVYLLIGAALSGFVLLVVPVLMDQAGALLAGLPHHATRARQLLSESSSPTLQRLAAALPAALTAPDGAPAAAGGGTLPVGELLGYVGVVGRNLFTAAAVLLLGFYWTLEGDRRVRELVLFAPLEQRRGIRAFIAEAESKVGGYVRGQTMVCLVMGMLAFVMFSLIGLPSALMLGATYALLEAVPVIGPLVGTAAAALVALSVRPSLVAWVVGAAVVLQLFENYVLIPRVMNRAVGVSPLVTLLAISGFGSVLGISGAVLAIPMAAIIQLVIDRFVLGPPHSERAAAGGGRDRLSVVRYEARQVALDARKLLRGGGPATARRAEKLEDAVEGIALDLDRLLDDTGARR